MAVTLVAALVRLYRLGTLPPQAWVDEVWIALRARDLLRTGEFHAFYPTWWGGMHPLMVVATAAAGWLGLASSPVAGRAVSATAGVLSVPLAYACLGEVLRPLGWAPGRRRLAALLAAGLLATLVSYLVVGRIGYEPVIPVTAALFLVWQLQRAVRLTRTRPSSAAAWGAWLLAGLALGGSQYISQHARFILPLFAWFTLHLLALAGQQRRSLLLRLAVLLAVAAVVVAPLAAFFWREPEWFLGRARAVTASVGPAGWLRNAGLILLSFSLRGDLDARHNLPGRPLLDALQSVGLWLGLGWALLHVRRAAPARDLLAWAGIMLLPSLLTDRAPQFERMVGFVAPGAALVAIGWLVAWDALRARWPAAAAQWPRGVAVAAVVGSLAWNAWTYFGPYAAHPDLAAAFTATPVELARTLMARANSQPVFVERALEADDVFAFDFLLPGSAVRRLDFRQCLPLADGRLTPTTYLVLSERDPQAAARLQALYPAAAATLIQPEPAALMGAATLVDVPAGARLPPVAHPLTADFGEGLTLLGYDWSGPEARPGESILITLYWKATQAVAADWTAFAHLTAGPGSPAIVAQHDGAPCQGFYATSAWQPGDVVADGFALTVPPEAAPGDYALVIGWYRYPSLERLPVLRAAQALPDDRVLLATVRVR